MSALPTTIHWAILYPILAIFIGTTTVLTEVIRNTKGKRWSIFVPIGGVLFLAWAAYGLARTGAFCAFCE